MSSLLFLVLAGASPAVAHDKARIGDAPNCPRATSIHAYDGSKPLKPQKLGELPPANAYSAVYRLIRGCEVPIVVKYGVGGR